MNRTIALTIGLVTSLALAGCELFVVGGGSRKPQQIERSQRTAPGVVHLFKAEVDSGNTTAATELMLNTNGRPLLAVEKFELSDDLQRWKTIMAQKPISETTVDTLSDSTHSVRITLDYVRTMQFSTLRKQGLWWVTKIQDAPKR
ncbi:MAG TPA: hypothetical protein VK147_05370 [Candidatus Didemnitutus sp.]|nr:hypothetical protein [Candidatus Didemnitutus sp.]